MEGRMVLLVIVLFDVAHGLSFGKARSPGFLIGKENSTAGHVAVNPQFIEEPHDKFILPYAPGALSCEAKFVSKLKFNCSGKLVPKEILNDEYIDNVTFLLAEISASQIKNRTSVFHCYCVATGYNGQVIQSRAATVQRAYLDENFVIFPSVDTRVQKNSLLALRCKPPAGNPSPAVSWWKDGRSVATHKNKRLFLKSDSNSSLVIIRKAKLSDGGDYSCVASNLVGRRESAIVKLTVYVDGGWSEWTEFQPCDAAKCGNGTKMFKRICSNPEPENRGQICTGNSIKIEQCQGVCPDVEITCPNHTEVYNNQLVAASRNVSWDKPIVRNKKNDTKFFVEVFPPWAEPPVKLPEESRVYVIKYVVKNEFGQTASCSFNVTVHNDSAPACGTGGCNVEVTDEPEGATPSAFKSGDLLHVLLFGLVFVIAMLALLFMANYMCHRRKRNQKSAATEHYEGVKATSDSELNVVTCSASYVESAVQSRKLRDESPIDSEVFDFPVPVSHWKEPPKTMHIEVEITDQKKREKSHDFKRTNSSTSNKSTVSEISRMMWNISNIPENVDPKMAAWGLVDHNGGKFTIGNTGVSLTVPPLAIPEGRTEGIYIAIVDQEKEHPQVTSKESLLSPVVKCGPTGLKFQHPVILSMPHCALLEEGAWNLKVQYNESEPSTAADWKQLIDVNRQDGSEPSHVVVDSNMVHLMVDHFTYFAVTGESAPNKQAPKDVQVLAYVTPPEVNGDCVVRVYCVGGTPAAIEDVHNQEIKKYRGETIEAPQQLRFKDGGGDLSVELKFLRSGWTSDENVNRIHFRDIWEGIQRMPNCTFVFSLSDTSVTHFRAKFKARQDCEDGDERDVNVVTSVKQGPGENPGPSKEETNHSTANLACACEHSTNLPKAVSSPCVVDHSTALVNAGSLAKLWQHSQADVPGACGGNAGASPVSLKQMSSGYFSVGFESLPTAHSLSRELRSKLSVILDPPHENDWKVLAEKLGLGYTGIRWIECRNAFSPTEILFNLWETTDSLKLQYPLQKMANILQEMGRDDAVEVIEAQFHGWKETTV